MKKPSIGRIVMFVPPTAEGATRHIGYGGNSQDVLPAVIVAVWSDECVNLKVLTDAPTDAWETSVHYDEAKGGRSWHWPEIK